MNNYGDSDASEAIKACVIKEDNIAIESSRKL